MSSRGDLKDYVFLQIADNLGQLGTCDRAKVGAVVTRDGRAVSWGFNGSPPGLPHCDNNGHGWGYKHPHEEGKADLYELNDRALEAMRGHDPPWDYRGGIEWLTQQYGCRNATHAEANALAFAARQGISTDGGTCYCAYAPCDTCARLLIAAGISRVVYRKSYRDPSGVDLLSAAGLEVCQIEVR